MLSVSVKELNHLLGNIDIYLLDQILKARFHKSHKILDAGCGEGRNLIYFIRNGYRIWAIDRDVDAIQMLKYLVKSIDKEYPINRFISGHVENLPYNDEEFDAVISSAVLHFAENQSHFLSMIGEMVRILKPGGTLFVRMAADMGMEDKIQPLKDGKFLLPDKSVRYLLTRQQLYEIINDFGFGFIEPFKTVIVDEKRCMSTLVLKKL